MTRRAAKLDILGANRIAGREQRRSQYGVLQLADVPGPVPGRETRARIGGDETTCAPISRTALVTK